MFELYIAPAVQAANTGNAQQDVTIFPSEMIDGVEWTGRFPTVTRLADGKLMAACYMAPVAGIPGRQRCAYALGSPNRLKNALELGLVTLDDLKINVLRLLEFILRLD